MMTNKGLRGGGGKKKENLLLSDMTFAIFKCTKSVRKCKNSHGTEGVIKKNLQAFQT